MIENQNQFNVTLKQLDQFREALKNLPNDMHPIQLEVHREALQSQIAEMESEIEAYKKKSDTR